MKFEIISLKVLFILVFTSGSKINYSAIPARRCFRVAIYSAYILHCFSIFLSVSLLHIMHCLTNIVHYLSNVVHCFPIIVYYLSYAVHCFPNIVHYLSYVVQCFANIVHYLLYILCLISRILLVIRCI